MSSAELVLEPAVDPSLDHVAVENARLVRTARAELLTHAGAITIDMLAHARNSSEGATRQWLRRQRQAHRMLAVEHQGRTLLPTMQFTDMFDLDPDVTDVVAQLTEFGMDGWAVWFWFYATNPWIERRPIDALADGDAASVHLAVHRLVTA